MAKKTKKSASKPLKGKKPLKKIVKKPAKAKKLVKKVVKPAKAKKPIKVVKVKKVVKKIVKPAKVAKLQVKAKLIGSTMYIIANNKKYELKKCTKGTVKTLSTLIKDYNTGNSKNVLGKIYAIVDVAAVAAAKKRAAISKLEKKVKQGTRKVAKVHGARPTEKSLSEQVKAAVDSGKLAEDERNRVLEALDAKLKETPKPAENGRESTSGRERYR